ncbi:hypothetical protein [Mesorhizobium sp.]|uniref:hypothetical protein n=1 Tax=Mesorhizobium sp. TaxID=1871066 RepID=UPI000FD5AA78|nr:hypothetical protein [Mesorhizobium sp.]RUV98327.1 hypothetical protein EOA88_00370 [Mesorhizobium sp. M5C.F.Ca.IN.020.14.1.1]RWI99136.1 MAG: hypothetical protein EOR23_33870 [Mesorhizobium sp.]
MKTKGYQKAQDEIADAREAVRRMVAADTLGAAEREWRNFLEHFARMFNKLLIACKGDTRAYPWFGKKKNEREKNPLLIYLSQARHSNEHSIEDSTEHVTTSITFDGPPGTISIDGPLYDENGNIRISAFSTSSNMTVTHGLTGLRILPVTNRGVTYTPPIAAAGTVIESTPRQICEAAIAYAEELLEEAAQFLDD